MEQFKVRLERMDIQCQDIEKHEKKIQEMEGNISSIRIGLRQKLSAMDGIGNRLKVIEDTLQKESAMLAGFGEALEMIVSHYRKGEKSIVGFRVGSVSQQTIEMWQGESEDFEDNKISLEGFEYHKFTPVYAAAGAEEFGRPLENYWSQNNSYAGGYGSVGGGGYSSRSRVTKNSDYIFVLWHEFLDGTIGGIARDLHEIWHIPKGISQALASGVISFFSNINIFEGIHEMYVHGDTNAGLSAIIDRGFAESIPGFLLAETVYTEVKNMIAGYVNEFFDMLDNL